MKKSQSPKTDIESIVDHVYDALDDKRKARTRSQVNCGIAIANMAFLLWENGETDFAWNVYRLHEAVDDYLGALRPFGHILAQISQQELRRLLRLRLANGHRLSLAHIAVLAAVSSDDERQALARLTIAESLTVHQLLGMIPRDLKKMHALNDLKAIPDDLEFASEFRLTCDDNPALLNGMQIVKRLIWLQYYLEIILDHDVVAENEKPK